MLDRLTETLRRQDLAKLMDCVQLLLRHGTAVFLLTWMKHSCSDTRATSMPSQPAYIFRLYPGEYGPRLFELLGWEGWQRRSTLQAHCCGRRAPPCFLFGIYPFRIAADDV